MRAATAIASEKRPGGFLIQFCDFGNILIPECAAAEFAKVPLGRATRRPKASSKLGRQWLAYEARNRDRAREAYTNFGGGFEPAPRGLTWAEFLA